MKQFSFSSIGLYLLLAFVVLLSSSAAQAQDWIYTTVKGDNLWNLSEQHLDKVTRFEQLRRLNDIENPKLLQPGTQIRVPLAWIRSNPVAAEIVSLTGTIQLKRANTSGAESAIIGSALHLGDELRTAANSTVAIQFADQSILTLHENSIVRFDHLSAHGTTGMVDSRLNLLKGRMDTDVTPAVGPGSRFEIQTPSAISAVRGTVYRALVSEQSDASNIEVLEGKVAVSGADQQFMVNQGFGTQVVSGKPPLPPRELLPAPLFEAIPAPITQINSRISWSAVDDASAYRVEIAAHESFKTLLWQSFTERNYVSLPDLPDGDYALRVRAIDAIGLEGLNRTSGIKLNARPQPPLALSPANEQIIRGQAPMLQWTASEDASAYHLEIASDSNFTQLVINSTVDASEFEALSINNTGLYHWRLSSIAADGEQGPPGPARSFEIKPIPNKVDASVAEEENGLLSASWREDSAEQSYQVQIAQDKAFSDILTDEHVHEPSFSFEPFEGEPRYLRVKRIEADGYEGPWGSTQTIAPLPPEPVNYWPLGIWSFLVILVI
jgi:hypothetical protein